jgi:7,8-dihydropterin-6-yl-methyl-4-(beta-D-ribofuranosyl)aminobenzene 5'-phosphate synthase
MAKIASNAKIYMHSNAISPRFSKNNLSIKSIGMPDYSKTALIEDNLVWTDRYFRLFPGVSVTGQIPRIFDYEKIEDSFFADKDCRIPDKIIDDQAIFFESVNGLVIILGCAHSGVVNTLDYISTLTRQNRVYAIVGGMHLLNANQKRIANTIEAFKKYEIQKIIPLHCTGQKAVKHLKEAFGDKCILSGVGETISF